MRILIADDEPLSRSLTRATLATVSAVVECVADGNAAWDVLERRPEATLLVADCSMPGLDGIELCKRLRSADGFPPIYIIMVTCADETADVTAGFEAGADDYVIKPFNADELRARARVGLRMLALQQGIARRVAELEAALARVKILSGLLPMCCYCKKIRVDDSYWQQLEAYISDHSDATFSHGICPTCYPAALDAVDRDSL
jgi:phosphoserine phosphatase RsbU/P